MKVHKAIGNVAQKASNRKRISESVEQICETHQRKTKGCGSDNVNGEARPMVHDVRMNKHM